jgi:hypothetical protein
MDKLDLWRDTLLIVCTDHGFLLGEHDWWAKARTPWYNEIAHIPLLIWDPRYQKRNERRQSLVQVIDFSATLLEFFGIERPPDMQGQPLRNTIAHDASVRMAALFGVFGGHINVTDGQFVYMRAPTAGLNGPLYEYTLMPTHLRTRFSVEELRTLQLSGPFSFTKGCRVMKIAGRPWTQFHDFKTMLFDLQSDPGQQRPINNPAIEKVMLDHMVRLMKENDAPQEQFRRLTLEVHTPEAPRRPRTG